MALVDVGIRGLEFEVPDDWSESQVTSATQARYPFLFPDLVARAGTSPEALRAADVRGILPSSTFEAARPLARGWGVEVGLTVDVVRAGLTVLEVPCELHHRVTGSDWRGQLHRAKQYRDVLRALRARGLSPRTIGRAARGS